MAKRLIRVLIAVAVASGLVAAAPCAAHAAPDTAAAVASMQLAADDGIPVVDAQHLASCRQVPLEDRVEVFRRNNAAGQWTQGRLQWDGSSASAPLWADTSDMVGTGYAAVRNIGDSPVRMQVRVRDRLGSQTSSGPYRADLPADRLPVIRVDSIVPGQPHSNRELVSTSDFSPVEGGRTARLGEKAEGQQPVDGRSLVIQPGHTAYLSMSATLPYVHDGDNRTQNLSFSWRITGLLSDSCPARSEEGAGGAKNASGATFSESGNLAATGADALAAVGLAAVLVGAGWLIAAARRRNKNGLL